MHVSTTQNNLFSAIFLEGWLTMRCLEDHERLLGDAGQVQKVCILAVWVRDDPCHKRLLGCWEDGCSPRGKK